MKLPSQLTDALLRGRVVPFVGAGFSMPSGCPSWSSIVQQMVADDDITELVTGDAFSALPLPDVSELLDSLGYNSRRASEFFAVRLDDPRLAPSEYHQLLTQLSFRKVITTNWDRLLEAAYRQKGDAVRVIYRSDDVPAYDERSYVNIIKLHGTIESPKSLIYRKSQYESYWQKHMSLLELVRTILTTHHAVFIGYGMGDPNIIDLLNRIRSEHGEFMREHWIVAAPGSMAAAEWRRLGLNVLPADQPSSNWDPQVATIGVLESMLAAAASVSGNNLERARLVNQELDRTIRAGRPNAMLRMRGQLGWLSNPKPDSEMIVYGSLEQDEEEYRMTQLVKEFLRNHSGNRVRLMVSVDLAMLCRKYEREAAGRRLRALRENLIELGERVEPVLAPHHYGMNEMIFDEGASLIGYKSTSDLRIARVVVTRDPLAVANQVRNFDADFTELLPSGDDLIARIGAARRAVIDALDSALGSLRVAEVATGWETSEVLSRAVQWTVARHAALGQTREDGETPYWVHPLRTLALLLEHEANVSVEAQVGCLLHDLVEDTATTVAEIQDAFGAATARIVDTLTHRRGQSWMEYLSQLREASPDAKAVKLADRLDNVRELIRQDYDSYGHTSPGEYLAGSVEVAHACRHGASKLADLLESEARRALASDVTASDS